MARTAKLNQLTELKVRAYAAGSEKHMLADGGGLYLRRLVTGCYWCLKLTSPESGKTQWYSLFSDEVRAAYPAKSLADARRAAAELWRQRANGIEPRADEERRRLARAAETAAARAAAEAAERRITVRQLFERWCATQLQPQTRADGKRTGRKDGGQYVREQFERHIFPSIGQNVAEELRKADLLALLDAQTSTGKMRTANVLLAELKQMLDFALERELIPTNPLATVKKRQIGGASVERERTLSEDEVKLLVTAIPAANLQVRSVCAIWIGLATGARAGELMGAIWAEHLPSDASAAKVVLDGLRVVAEAEGVKLGVVDTKAKTWYLADTKNQRDHTIHLSAFALQKFEVLKDLLGVLRGSTDGTLSPWAFPATDNHRPVCVKSFGKQLADRQRPAEKRLTNRAKATTSLQLPGGKWTAHDLRRTTATFMARLGFGSDVINEALNHIQSDRMSKVYIRDRREAEQAKAFDALGVRLQAMTSDTPMQTNEVPGPAA